jgi:hypothetical protein
LIPPPSFGKAITQLTHLHHHHTGLHCYPYNSPRITFNRTSFFLPFIVFVTRWALYRSTACQKSFISLFLCHLIHRRPVGASTQPILDPGVAWRVRVLEADERRLVSLRRMEPDIIRCLLAWPFGLDVEAKGHIMILRILRG